MFLRGFSKLFVVIIFVSLDAYGQIQPGQTLIIPRDLAELAERQGCHQYNEHYDRVGEIGPPYVYGVARVQGEQGAAFWCERAKYDYALMFVTFGRRGPEYAGEIRSMNRPGGLTVSRIEQDVSMEGIREIVDTEYDLPTDLRFEGLQLSSKYDGSGEFYLNISGKWYRGFSH